MILQVLLVDRHSVEYLAAGAFRIQLVQLVAPHLIVTGLQRLYLLQAREELPLEGIGQL